MEAGHGPGYRDLEEGKAGEKVCEMPLSRGVKEGSSKSRKRRCASTHLSGSIVGGSNGLPNLHLIGQMIWEDARSRDKQAKAKAKEELEAA